MVRLARRKWQAGRKWQAIGVGLAALALGSAPLLGPAGPFRPASPAGPVPSSGLVLQLGSARLPGPARLPDSARSPGPGGTHRAAPSRPALPGEAGRGSAAACGAFPGAGQLPGADGVRPAAWTGGGLVVPACGPAPGDGPREAAVYPYPGALWTAGYQCVEFSERYLYDRYGVAMDVATNGDQVAAHYATDFPGLFRVIRNGAAGQPPAPGDVLSLSTAPGFDSVSGGHTAVVQAADVDAAGNGTVTVVEENGSAAGVTRLAVTGWTVRYPGFRYLEWLAPTGQPVIRQANP